MTDLLDIIWKGLDWGGNGIPEVRSDVDWCSVHREAAIQTVSGVAFDGMRQLVEAGQSKIDKQLMLSWYSEVMRIEKVNAVVNAVMGEVTKLFRNEGIPFVVMKGQTAAALYPTPNHRQPGDIDITVWGGRYLDACKALNEQGAVFDEEIPEKHSEFQYHGVTVEVHHTMLDLCNSRALQYLRGIDLRNVTQTRDVAGMQIPCLKDEFNCVYMLGHMVHHLMVEGLGLRQVCDWMVLMQKAEREDNFNREELQRHLKGMKMERACGTFLQLGIKYFGLNRDLWQKEIGDSTEKDAERLLNFIMESGNFGRKQNMKKDSHSLWGNICNALLYAGHLCKLRRLAPSEVWAFYPARIKRWWLKRRKNK